MIDHRTCRRTTVDASRPTERVWRCSACLKQLASMSTAHPIVLDPTLRPLNTKHDGLPTYGVPPRVLMGRHGDARNNAVVLPSLNLNIYLYCPRVRRGEERCGTGQHLGG